MTYLHQIKGLIFAFIFSGVGLAYSQFETGAINLFY